MSDTFQGQGAGLTSPGFRHYAVTPADADLPIRPRALWVDADGTAILRDETGVDVTYDVIAGQIIPFRAVQVRAASTATLVAWY